MPNTAMIGSRASVSVLTLLALPGIALGNLKIQATFDPSIANDPNAAQIEGTLNSVLSLYEASFVDDITVKVYFQTGGGLGSSAWGYYYNNASAYNAGFIADAKSADDAEAISLLNTVGFGSLAVTSANGRALGYATPGFLSAGGQNDLDGIISLNTAACFYDHNDPQPGQFDLFGAAAHELDEVLGTVSGAGDWLAFAADLYRYDGQGNRNFSGDTSTHAYFSIDGTHLINEYNQFGRTQGDWGDWIMHSPSQAQDWVLQAGQSISPGEPEFRLLDVLGYDRVNPVPEPSALVVLGFGALAMMRRRRSR